MMTDQPVQQEDTRTRRSGLSRREIMMAAVGAIVGVAIIGAVWLAVGQSEGPALPAMGELNRPTPDVTMPLLDGDTTVRLTDLRGKVVLVNFWATWCEPCKEETPALQAVHEQLQAEGLVILGVNLRRQETDDEVVRAFVQEYGVTYPIALDIDGEAARLFQISPIPTSYFIDPAGTVRYVRVGTLTAEDVTAIFERLRQTTATTPS